MWSRGQAETVRRWLGAFTDRQILDHPALTLTAGWVYTALDAGGLGERWCEAACGAPMDDSPSPDGAASLRSSQALLRATVGADGVRRMREDAELAARLEATPGTSWYADAQVALGVARWLSGVDPAGPASARRRRAGGLGAATRPPSSRRSGISRSSARTRPSGTSPRSTR